MSAETSKEIQLKLAHVLFLDMVGYSKLRTDEQRESLDLLNQLVRKTEAFRGAEGGEQLLRISTGDGMALVFYNTPEAPVRCAVQISQALNSHPEIRVRMGIHSGLVSGTIAVNDRAQVAGAGINLAHRVMDCGDGGHILLSRRVAEDLAEFREWQPHLHELGETEVKHGVIVSVFNLYGDGFGNPELPQKFRIAASVAPTKGKSSAWLIAARWLPLLAVLAAAGWFLAHRTAPPVAAPPAAPLVRQVGDKSIAVLPFDNLSDEKQNAFFADGVQDEILTNLAKIADLKVISRTSVMQYRGGTAQRNLREIGQALGVAHLLEGSVQRAANHVRVNAQLIDARTDAHLWAETYDGDLADVFAIQSKIAKAIADQLQAKLSKVETAGIEKPSTTDLAAFDLYLRAQALVADTTDPSHAKEKLPEAARLLSEAVKRDPLFLVGWCLLSRVHSEIFWGGFDHTPARLEFAKSAVETALRIDPDAGDAHLAMAVYYYRGFRDYARAHTELEIAHKTLPNNADVFQFTGMIQRREGNWEEATRNLERTLELDPRNFYTLQQLALTYQTQRRYADEARTYDRALAIAPGDANTRILRAEVPLDWQGDIKPYQTMLETLAREEPSSVVADVDDPLYSLCERTPEAAARLLRNFPRAGVVGYGVNYPHAYWEGVVARWQGDAAAAEAAFSTARAEVEKTVQQQPDFAAAISLLGMIDAGLGRKEDALGEGRRACELLPISKDALHGVSFAVNLAQIYAWVGEKDLALEQIAKVESVPNFLSYGFLKLQPMWDSLRDDARFTQIVASLAPSEAK